MGTSYSEPSWPGERHEREKTQPLSEWASSQARGMVDTARESVEQAGRYLQSAMEQTRDKVAQYRDQGFDKVKDDAVSYTRQQPVTALLIAAGAGLMLGWLTAMGRK
ncbi:MAG: hypothetical protein ACRELA_18295 [Candidatus Rokuibacteriota bacterium]